jgi:hypothetical protein
VASAPELEAFLSAKPTYNSTTFGVLDRPRMNLGGGAQFSGWALSPWGIRGVDLLFEQGSVRIPAILAEDRHVSAAFPWYPRTPKPRFVSALTKRPERVRVETDLQVEIIDGRGKRTRLPHQWIVWRDK